MRCLHTFGSLRRNRVMGELLSVDPFADSSDLRCQSVKSIEQGK